MRKLITKKRSAIATGAVLFLALSCKNPFFPHDSFKGDGGSAGGAQIIPLSMAPPEMYVWARSITKSNSHYSQAYFKSAAVDPAGSVFAAGYQYGGSITFDSHTVSGYKYINPVLVKFDATGQAKWATTFTAFTADRFDQGQYMSVAADGGGNCYASGSQTGNGIWEYGNGITSILGDCVAAPVLIKYDANGNTKWASATSACPDYAEFRSIAVAPDGKSIYAVGCQRGDGAYDYGDGTNPAVRICGSLGEFGTSPILVKYNDNGIAQWVLSSSAGSSSRLNSMAVDEAGNIYVVGEQYGGWTNYTSLSGPDITLVNSNGGYTNPVLIKYSKDGNVLWARTVEDGPGDGHVVFSLVTVDRDGGVYVAGNQRDPAKHTYGDNVAIQGDGPYFNPILIKYDADGNALWGKIPYEGPGTGVFESVAAAPGGGFFVAGYQNGSLEYNYGNGVTLLGASSGSSPALIKYDADGNAQWAKTTTGGPSDGTSIYNAVAVGGNGFLYAAGIQVDSYPYPSPSYSYGELGDPQTTIQGPLESWYNPVIVKYRIP